MEKKIIENILAKKFSKIIKGSFIDSGSSVTPKQKYS
jgi:hypothetical protein